jgi:hypothetical protein
MSPFHVHAVSPGVKLHSVGWQAFEVVYVASDSEESIITREEVDEAVSYVLGFARCLAGLSAAGCATLAKHV